MRKIYRRAPRPLLAAVVLTFALWSNGCSALRAPTPTPAATPVTISAETVTIMNPIARPAPVAGGNGAIYLTLANTGLAPVQLVRAESPAAAAVEIHETTQEEGVMRMRHLPEGVSVPPEGHIALEPGGLHIMLVELAAPLAIGDRVDLTLYLESEDPQTGTPISETVVLDVPVGEPDGDAAGAAEHDDH